ncbi:MAG: hypothetical protein ABEI32_05020 [Halothece sp.]
MKIFKLVLATFLLLSLSSCRSQTQLYRLNDVTENQQILLRKKSIAKPSYGLLIMAQGYLEGQARIALLRNGNVYQTEVISGNVKFQWREKWQDHRAIIRYQPSSVTDGNLRVSVTFLD